MQFRDLPERLLGSKVKIKIIRRLLSDESITSERELAQLIGVSPGAANRVLKELHDYNFITPMRVGNISAWQVNKESYAYWLLEKLTERIKTTPLEELNDNIKRYTKSGYPSGFSIYPSFGANTLNIKKIVLYGSVVSGTELPNSDIDLFILVVGNDDRKKVTDYFSDLITFFLRRYGNRLSLNIFTMEEYLDQKNKKFLENVSQGIVVMER